MMAGARRQALMACLREHEGNWVSPDVLAVTIYGGDSVDDLNALRTLIHNQRRADPGVIIETLPMVGYRLKGPSAERA